jgi:hypothetical protein
MAAVLLVPPPPAPSIPMSSRHHCHHRPLLRPTADLIVPPRPLLAFAPPLLLLPCVGRSRGWPPRRQSCAPASGGHEPPHRRSRAPPRTGWLRATSRRGSLQHHCRRPALPIRPHWGRGRPPELVVTPSPAARHCPSDRLKLRGRGRPEVRQPMCAVATTVPALPRSTTHAPWPPY